ncbi:unnamed protein product [Chrysoparadoxa australica]
MFIKKDGRKIPEILADGKDERKQLQLGRRSNEFKGSLKLLANEGAVARLQNLEKLSVYDCLISSISGIGLLGGTPMQHLNLGSLLFSADSALNPPQHRSIPTSTAASKLPQPQPTGRNQLRNIPDELGLLRKLETLWLDDNQLTSFPACLTKLTELREVRLPGNRISSLPADMSQLDKLQILDLGNNQLEEVGATLGTLSALQVLILRQNDISVLPEALSKLKRLKMLAVSTNKLRALTPALGEMECMEELYANSNTIIVVPKELAALKALRKVNLSANDIKELPKELRQAWQVKVQGEKLVLRSGFSLTGNPIAKPKLKTKSRKPAKMLGAVEESHLMEESEEVDAEKEKEGEK